MKLQPIAPNCTQISKGDGTRILFSYESPVAAFIPGRGYVRTDKKWSNTTSKHINKWLGKVTAQLIPQSELDALV